MKNAFVSQVIRERIVDTRRYRYIAREHGDGVEILRLPLADLDTTAAIDGWEKVAEIR